MNGLGRAMKKVDGRNFEQQRASRFAVGWIEQFFHRTPTTGAASCWSQSTLRSWLLLGLVGSLAAGAIQSKAEERLELGTRGGFSYASGHHTFWQVEASASW